MFFYWEILLCIRLIFNYWLVVVFYRIWIWILYIYIFSIFIFHTISAEAGLKLTILLALLTGLWLQVVAAYILVYFKFLYFEKICFIFNHVFVCSCVGICTSAGIQGTQRHRMLSSWIYRRLWVASHACREPNLGLLSAGAVQALSCWAISLGP